MADVKISEQRSRNMAAIKGKDTKPERVVRKYLFSQGLLFRVQVRKLPGTADIILPKYKTAIFVNGCFWQGMRGVSISNCQSRMLTSGKRRLIISIRTLAMNQN